MEPSLYSIELVAFEELGRDDATYLLAEAFGIPAEAAVSFIDRAPTVVRSGINEGELAEYVSALLEIGADVRVVDESTGADRVYRAKEYLQRHPSGQTQAASDPFNPSNFNAKTASGSYQTAGPAARNDSFPGGSSAPYPGISSGAHDIASGPFSSIDNSPRQVVPSGTHPGSGNPFERRASGLNEAPGMSGAMPAAQAEIACPRCGVKQPVAKICAACGIVFDKFFAKNRDAGIASGSYPGAGSGSFDGVGAGSPGTYGGHSAPCDSCGRRRDYSGGTCRHCGWDNDRHFRRCVKCGSVTRITSANLSALYFLVGIGGAAGVVFTVVTYSIMAGLAVLAGSTAVTLLAVAITSMYRCGKCRETVDTNTLGGRESRSLRATRLMLMLFAAALVAFAVVVGPGELAPPEMKHTTSSGRYSVALPSNHKEIHERTLSVTSPMGTSNASIYISEGPEYTFFLVHREYAAGTNLALLTEDEIRAELDGMIALQGGEIVSSHPTRFRDYTGWEQILDFPYGGRTILARGRVFVFGHEMVWFGGSVNDLSATEQDTPELNAFLDSFKVER